VFCCGRRCPPRRLCWPYRASLARQFPHRPVRPLSGSLVTVHQPCPRLSWRTPTMRLSRLDFLQCRLQQPGWHLLHSVCIFRGVISPSHLASYALDPDASCCATEALSAPLADSTLAVPSARVGAVNDPPRLYTSTPEGRLPSRLCLHSIALPVCARAPRLCMSTHD
jgi:hypothetical protein